ncbi:MAG TPA: carboxylating nicotinate-nucleotide diphosphorylase [Acidobacteriota bacterium]|nr:carboxylating nicotinate-nucleotide diphosphorylase [Acidobacteriota bacterium]
MDWNSREITDLIDRALAEDIGDGDITTRAIVSRAKRLSAVFLAKEKGILAGVPLLRRIWNRLDSSVTLTAMVRESKPLKRGQIICRVRGPARALLSGERVALNFLQRLCGIATQTAFFASQAKPFGIEVLDTRKTTPLLRSLEKYAVAMGGGTNHRFGLQDQVLVKDNHLKIEPDFARILKSFAAKGYPPARVELEVASLKQLKDAQDAGGKWFLLDNMTPALVRKAVRMKRRGMKYEVSGGIDESNFKTFLIRGVDAISIGALTHSVKSLDISMEFE